jgi:flavin reductase (DIM6/NTAB) family NADH-FMN oxidoreductase RutF
MMVTTRVDDSPWGLTTSSCCSVSADPRLVFVSLGSATVSARRVAADGSFGVSVLSEDVLCAAYRGADPGKRKFIDSYCLPAAQRGGLHTGVVAAPPAHLDCELLQSIEVADHTLLIGQVRATILTKGKEPLLYDQRHHQALGLWPEDQLCGW